MKERKGIIRCPKCQKSYSKDLKHCPGCVLREAAKDLNQKLQKAHIKIKLTPSTVLAL